MPDKTVMCVDLDGKTYKVPAASLTWRPSAYAVVIKDDALLVSPQFDGYDLPGGGVEIGEMPTAAVIREAKEETGIDVALPQLIDAASNLFKLPHTDKDGYIQSIMLYYMCTYKGGKLSMDGFDEYEQQYARMPEWLPLEKLDSIKVASSVDWRPFVRKAMLVNTR